MNQYHLQTLICNSLFLLISSAHNSCINFLSINFKKNEQEIPAKTIFLVKLCIHKSYENLLASNIYLSTKHVKAAFMDQSIQSMSGLLSDTVDLNISVSDIHSTITDFESTSTTPVMMRVRQLNTHEDQLIVLVDILWTTLISQR